MVAEVESELELAAQGVRPRGPWRQALARFARNRLGVAAGIVLGAFVVVSIFAGLLAPYPAGDLFIEYIGKPQPPLSPHHLLGTDVLSHDLLTQILYATRQTVVSSLVCAAGATIVGVVLGAIAGFYGGVLDSIVTWASGVLVAVPAIAILIVITVWSSAPVPALTYALWLIVVLWTGIARVVSVSVKSLESRPFVEAARSAGASDFRLLTRHLLPSSAGLVLVAAAAVFAQSIVLIATIDFLGYGFNKAEQPTLGGLVSDATHSHVRFPQRSDHGRAHVTRVDADEPERHRDRGQRHVPEPVDEPAGRRAEHEPGSCRSRRSWRSA